jgi:predicted short-subunit dehydrogenase-like oxidoreductase (DUF2520 family)
MSPRSRPKLGSVVVVGAGKVGRSLGRALRAAGADVRVVSARTGRPGSASRADLVIVATRDADIRATAERLAGIVRPSIVALHVAGARGLGELEALAARGVHVGSAHPLLAFASSAAPPTFAGAALVLDGAPRAIRAGRALAAALGMRPVHLPGLDRATYHAAAALAANGAAALAGAASSLLLAASVPKRLAPVLLGPLLRSVAENVTRLGAGAALTGPVRRGDAAAVAAHAAALDRRAPSLSALYRELVRAQVPIARALREVDPASLDAVLDQL